MEIKGHLLPLQFWIRMVSFPPSPSTFSPFLQSCCWRKGGKKIICSVQGDSFDPHYIASLFLSLAIQKAISNARRCHVACFMGELNLLLLKPKQTVTNSLTSVILLGFQTSYSNVVPHIKQYFEQHDCAYLSDFVQREKYLTSLVFTAVHGLEPEKNICLFSLINLFY